MIENDIKQEKIININISLTGEEFSTLILALNEYQYFEVNKLEYIKELLEKIEKNIIVIKDIFCQRKKHIK